MTLCIRPCTIAELEASPNIKQLQEEYAREAAIEGLPPPEAKVETYRNFESIKAIHVIGAFVDDMLAGFIFVLAPILPHYSIRVAVGESFFVAKDYRGTGAGLKLLRAAEKYAQEAGACGILMSAPLNGDFAEVLPHVGYTETNRVFFRKLGS